MAYLKLAAALMFAAGLLIYPAECAAAAREAMHTWAEAVAPALFPFAAVMPFLTCAEARHIYDKLFGPAVRRLFRLPGSTASAIIVGMVAGSPGGAMAAARVAAAEGMTKGQAARLSGISCGVSPVYAMSVMGVGMFGSQAAGWRLIASQWSAQLIAGMIFRNADGDSATVPQRSLHGDERPVMAAALAAIRVCGYMVAFSVGITLLEMIFGGYIWKISAFIDLPTGIAHCIDGKIAAAALGFGGICIGAQNMGVLEDMVKPSVYYLQKGITAVVCACVYSVLEMMAGGGGNEAFVRDGRTFEINLLILSAISVPVTAVFLGKRSKKSFS